MAGGWPDWGKIEELVKSGRYVAGNSEFNTFKKKVLKASIEEIEAQAEHAVVTWDFLIGFAGIKNMYRNLIIQVFNKLTQAPSWVAAFESSADLSAKMKTLHEDLQAALGAQHEVIQKSIAPNALKSMAFVRREEQPEIVRQAMEKEKLVDAIRDECVMEPAFNVAALGDQEATLPIQMDKPLSALQDGIDAVVAINDDARMANGGSDALNLLRIGCVKCAGQEAFFQHEINHVHEVFSFLLAFTKRKPGAVSGVAEVMNVLMASPSWSATFEASPPLQEGLRELPLEAQAALGLQHEKVMQFISPDARKKATGGDVPEAVKGVAARMQSISHMPAGNTLRAAIAAAAEPIPQPQPAPKDEWREARTPEGHVYYYNLSTRASTWERPAALGGSRVYRVGDPVEVWSNGMRVWGRGKVEKVEGDKVTAEFTLPNAGVAKKELPASHKDLRPAAAAPVAEGWSAAEQPAYQSWFASIPGDTAEKPATAVAEFLASSRLERPVLKQVWAVANPGSKTALGFEEFAQCCRLVAHCQALNGQPVLKEADRPLRVKLREECLLTRPQELPKFNR